MKQLCSGLSKSGEIYAVNPRILRSMRISIHPSWEPKLQTDKSTFPKLFIHITNLYAYIFIYNKKHRETQLASNNAIE